MSVPGDADLAVGESAGDGAPDTLFPDGVGIVGGGVFNDRFVWRFMSERQQCSVCLEWVEGPLNADLECEICAALMSLKATMERKGLIHPDLFDHKNAALPPGDRE